MAKIVDIFEILVTQDSTTATIINVKKSIVNYFNSCSLLLQKFGFETVLQTLVQNYKKIKHTATNKP